MLITNDLSLVKGGLPERAAAPSLGAGPSLRERILDGGAGGLGEGDLLTLALGPGRAMAPEAVARDLLARAGGLTGLFGLHPLQLLGVPGLGPASAARLVAALEMGRRACGPARRTGLKVARPEDLHPLLRDEFRGLDRERFLALYLDTRHRLLTLETVSIGSLNASVVHPREVFKLAVALSAAAVIVAHNHPSGCARPSTEDVELTRRLDRCGALLGIPLLDHLVAGDREILSLREEGWPAGGPE